MFSWFLGTVGIFIIPFLLPYSSSCLVPPQRCCLYSLPAQALCPFCETWTLPSGWQRTGTIALLPTTHRCCGQVGWTLPPAILPDKDPRARPTQISGPAGKLSSRVCVCRACTHAHILPCEEILAPPLSGEKGWRLNLEKGVSFQEGGWGGAVPEMTNLPGLFHFSPRTLEFPVSSGNSLPVHPSWLRQAHPFPSWGVIGIGALEDQVVRLGMYLAGGIRVSQSPSPLFVLLPPTGLPLPQGRVAGTGGIYSPTPHPPHRSFTKPEKRDRYI